jgi:hypothetical protein
MNFDGPTAIGLKLASNCNAVTTVCFMNNQFLQKTFLFSWAPESTRHSGDPATLGDQITVKKIALALLLAFTLFPAATFAQIYIHVRPPAPVYERRGPRPDRGYAWVAGYHRYDDGRYVWVPGHWDRPPREHAVWVRHHYVHRHRGWVLVEGHWR